LLEVGGVYDKDGGAALAGLGRFARIAQNVDDSLDVLFLYADEQRGVASPQETAGAGDAGHAVAFRHQLLNHSAGIRISDNGDDQFHSISPL
jgi:hypothetical protein